MSAAISFSGGSNGGVVSDVLTPTSEEMSADIVREDLLAHR